MKKILKLFISVLLISAASSNVVSCKPKQNDEFNEIIHDTANSYLIMLGGSDAPETKLMHSQIWNSVSTNPDTKLYTTTNGPLIDKNPNSSWNNYQNNSIKPYKNFGNNDNYIPFLSDAHVIFKDLEGEVTSKLWDEDWAKDIIKWCGQQSWNLTVGGNSLSNSDYVNRYTKKFETSKPLFIYIDHSNYRGIYTYDSSDDNGNSFLNSSTGNLQAEVFYYWAYKLLIGHYGYGEDTQNFSS